MAIVLKKYADPVTKEKQIKDWLERPYSWSQHCAFTQYSKEGWYKKYIEGTPTPTNKYMIFGSMIGKKIETDPTFLPDVPRQSRMEFAVETEYKGIRMVGYFDSYCPDTFIIEEYKTSRKCGWSQGKVDNHGQITFYYLLLNLAHGVKPKNVTSRLHHLETELDENEEVKLVEPFTLRQFKTKRTVKDINMLKKEIVATRKEMLDYAQNHA